ncbi:hypothetical protein BH10ACT11_BH10ACT11_01710 [soil metagenome]
MEQDTVGVRFARAMASKDFEAIRALMDAEVDFRGLPPNRTWEAGNPSDLISSVLRQWFEDSDEIESLESVETDSFSDRERVGYRFRGRNEDGPFVVEQQAFLASEDGRITWMRVVCSGFRPAD